jgi:DNA transformation protein
MVYYSPKSVVLVTGSVKANSTSPALSGVFLYTNSMAKPIDDYAMYLVKDVLGHLPQVTYKRMFGGFGLYFEKRIFAIITSDDEVCFKADAALSLRYETAGATQFVYQGHTSKKPTPMPYWRVPEAVLENRDLITEWVHCSAALSDPKE